MKAVHLRYYSEVYFQECATIVPLVTSDQKKKKQRLFVVVEQPLAVQGWSVQVIEAWPLPGIYYMVGGEHLRYLQAF